MDKNLILKAHELKNMGYSYGQIGAEMLITKSKANYLCRLDIDEENKKESSRNIYEQNVCELVKKCNSINEVCKLLGHKSTNEYYKQIQKIIDKYSLDTSHFGNVEKHGTKKDKKTLEELLQKNVTYQSTKLKDRLLNVGLKEHKCEICGRIEWNEKPIPLQLHHINGDNTDNRLENLQILCPNCHALTDNYCGKNKKEEPNKCEICGKIISRRAKYCTNCYHSIVQTKNGSNQKEYFIGSKIPKLKEELIESFKVYGSFRGVSKKYKVTDNTVRKWCEIYDLPRNALDMRNFVREYYNEGLKWNFTNGNESVLREYQKNNFKKVCLLDKNTNDIEKIYYSTQEIKNDGFTPKNVYRVCRGELITHKKRKFKYLEL